MNSPKISIITTTFNSAKTVEDTLKSVQSQTYKAIEHIIIDGASKDGTLDIIKKYSHVSILISESDKGIYDAMNKGIQQASGDVIGFLNSDDVFFDETVIGKIAAAFKNGPIDAVYGNLIYVNENDLSKIERYWRSSQHTTNDAKLAWQPPHPTFYARKSIYSKVGLFDLNFKIGADFEWLYRALFVQKINAKYIDELLVKMRLGGASNQSLKNRVILLKDYKKTYQKHHNKSGYIPILLRLLSRIPQFFNKKI